MITDRVLRYGDHVDTDAIIPARYLNITDMAVLAAHAMEDVDSLFHQRLHEEKIIVAGRNFGCGSSREHAPAVLKEAGVKLVIAHSFARIFYRNAINIGLPIIECSEASRDLVEGQTLDVSLEEGTIFCRDTEEQYPFAPYPPFMQRIIDAGGLIPALKKEAAR